jgi:hypothetical protein
MSRRLRSSMPARAASRARLGIAAAALAALAIASGCGTGVYDHTELDTTTPGGTNAPLASVVLEVGMAVEIAAIPMSADGPLGGDFTFDLASSDPSVLDVEAALGQTTGQADFVFLGVAPGDAQILVTLDDTARAPIPARVVPQPPPSP